MAFRVARCNIAGERWRMSPDCLSDSLARATIELEPFPHVVVPDALEPSLYRQLCASFPPFARIGWADPALRPPSNSRFELGAAAMLNDATTPQVWKSFAAAHSDRAFFDRVVERFDGHWPMPLRQVLDGALVGHTMERLVRHRPQAARIALDARIEINCPVIAAASSSRGPHLDTPNRIYSGLFYLRHPEDDSVGGDLQLFRWKTGPVASIDSYELPSDRVECVATIPYRPNLLVFFPQSIDALHGVSVRQPTPHFRRYVFITAELGENWLIAPQLPVDVYRAMPARQATNASARNTKPASGVNGSSQSGAPSGSDRFRIASTG
jgi:hypothetical protein